MTAMRLISWLLLLVFMQSGVFAARRFRGGRNPQPRRTPPSPTYRDRGDTTESFPLDFTAVEENMDNFMTQVKNLAQSLYPCSAQKLDYDMKLHFLENTSVTCNDGTPAGYCILFSSDAWLFFFRTVEVSRNLACWKHSPNMIAHWILLILKFKYIFFCDWHIYFRL